MKSPDNKCSFLLRHFTNFSSLFSFATFISRCLKVLSLNQITRTPKRRLQNGQINLKSNILQNKSNSLSSQPQNRVRFRWASVDGEHVALDLVAQLRLKVAELLLEDGQRRHHDGLGPQRAARLHVVEEPAAGKPHGRVGRGVTPTTAVPWATPTDGSGSDRRTVSYKYIYININVVNPNTRR